MSCLRSGVAYAPPFLGHALCFGAKQIAGLYIAYLRKVWVQTFLGSNVCTAGVIDDDGVCMYVCLDSSALRYAWYVSSLYSCAYAAGLGLCQGKALVLPSSAS